MLAYMLDRLELPATDASTETADAASMINPPASANSDSVDPSTEADKQPEDWLELVCQDRISRRIG